MISLSVFFSVLLPLVEEQDLSDDISGTFNRPPYRYPSLTHSKRNESIQLVTSLGGALQWLNPLISVIYIRAILESHITIRDGKFKHANWLRSHSDMSCHGSKEAQRTLVSSPGFVCTWATVSSFWKGIECRWIFIYHLHVYRIRNIHFEGIERPRRAHRPLRSSQEGNAGFFRSRKVKS